MIEFDGVSKWYGQVSALTDVSFRVEAGVVGLVGRNGAGKSSLMKLTAGLLGPSTGTVRLLGRDPRRPSSRREFGFVSDVDSYYEHLSGERFVTWMMRLHGFSARDARRRARDTLERLGLGDAMYRRIREYSKGMRQRVKLAQALAHDPQVVLLDEPMTGLDPVARHEMAEHVHSLAQKGVAVMVSSHVLHELESIAPRVLLIDRGRLVAEGAVGELRDQLDERPHHVSVRTDQPRQLAQHLTGIDVVSSVRVLERSVEVETEAGDDLFAELTSLGERGMVRGVRALDGGLEAVFGYLVDDRAGRKLKGGDE